MGILSFGATHKVPRLDFELMAGCDHACGHCYNVWNAKPDDPQGSYQKGQLRLADFKIMMEKAIRQSGARHITITGGEPLLKKGALEIIETACSLAPSVSLITNGSHVTDEAAARFKAAGLKAVQLTLLSADPAKHNLLKGADCFDDTVRAALTLREAQVGVHICFVAMRQNWKDFAEVMELCHLLQVRAIAYNRMSPTGGAVHEIARLLPEVQHVEANLKTADELGRKWKIPVVTAMPIPPCLINLERFDWVRFGFCSTGSQSPNLTIDPLGNVRSCNLSSGLLGNVLRQEWPEIMRAVKRYQKDFKKKVPEACRGCHFEKSCQGGCKESAFATFGDVTHPEPFRYLAMNPDWLDELAEGAQTIDCPGARMGRPQPLGASQRAN